MVSVVVLVVSDSARTNTRRWGVDVRRGCRCVRRAVVGVLPRGTLLGRVSCIILWWVMEEDMGGW